MNPQELPGSATGGALRHRFLTPNGDPVEKTIAHLFYAQTERYGNRELYYQRRNGGWVPTSWRQALRQSAELAAGLWTLGCRHGDRVAIIAETRPEWTACDLAALSCGAVSVGIYPTSTAEQTVYILQHSEAKVAIVEDLAQLAKIATARHELPALAQIVLIDGEEPTALPLFSLAARGRALLNEDPELIMRQVETVSPDDVAILVYTSGTTGPPKGVVLTHRNLYATIESTQRFLPTSDRDVGVVFLPLAHSLQRVTGYSGLKCGVIGYYAPSIAEVPETWIAAQPTVVASVPRIFEKIHAKIMTGLAEQPPLRRKIFAAALSVGLARSRYLQQRQPVPTWLQLPYQLADHLVFSKIRARTFGERVRFLVSGGAPISVALLEFFHAVGLQILEGYGLTETCAPATVNQPHYFKFGTVGRALPGIELRIADDGEVLIRGEGVFKAYYRDPEATGAALDADGWFRSGDIGAIDADGFLKITDRKKDLIITAGGKNIAPQNIENLIKPEPLISQVMVHGDQRHYLVALVTLDVEEFGRLCKQHGLSGPLETLVTHQVVRDAVGKIIEEKNATLARYETIKKFQIIPHDFTVESGMLTPTLKVKRRAIEAHYRELLNSLYA